MVRTNPTGRRWQVLVVVFGLYFAAVGILLYRIAGELDPRYREGTEEALVDTAQMLATLLEREAYDGVIQTDELARTFEQLGNRPIDARIFGIVKHRVDLRVYVTDRSGIVRFDSTGRNLGADFSGWKDVSRTLQGLYGARTTLDDPADPQSAVMYVGAPIRETGSDGVEHVIGMVAVGKPMAALRPYIANARERLALFGASATGAFALLLLAMLVWLIRPLGLLRELRRALWHTQPHTPRALFRRSMLVLRTAFGDLRDALTGRNYVEEYVQTLAHELKSPLAAIRGAAELLGEPMPEATRTRFTLNVLEQTGRAQDLIDRMLELSTLQRRSVPERIETVAVDGLLAAVGDELHELAAQRGVALACQCPAILVEGDPFLLQRAVSNLVRNAIDFAPRGSTIEMSATAGAQQIEILVRDHGPGLPPFARQRVFEKFFSLPRPDSGRRGTGLGLALVREIATLHGGKAELDNHPEGGALAKISLPRPGGGATAAHRG